MATWAARSQSPSTSSASAASLSVAYGSSPLAHSLLVVFVSWNGAGVTVTVSGGAGNAWVSAPQNNNGNLHGQFWYCLNAANVATTILATFSGTATNISLIGMEYRISGFTTQSIAILKDAEDHTGQAASGTAQTSGSFTPAQGDELQVGATGASTGTSWGAGGGFSFITSTSFGMTEELLNVFNSELAYTMSTSSGGSVASVTSAITFYVTSVGTTITPMPATEVQAGQAQIVVGTPPRFSSFTDPYGASNSGGGTNKVGQIYPTGRA